MYEVNENRKASDPVYQEGAHQSSLALYKQLRSRRPFNEAEMLQPYQWMRVTSTAVMTEAHFKCSSLSAQMAYHLTKEKIRDKYVSFSWDNLPDVDTAHLVRLWIYESNLMCRSHEFLKQVGFEEFHRVQLVRLHTSSTDFVDPTTRCSKNLRV